LVFFFQAEDGIRDRTVTGVQTCALPISFFEHKIRIIYSRIENCMSIDDIRHPSAREVIRYLGIDRGLEIHHDADLPARSGLGSRDRKSVRVGKEGVGRSGGYQ